MATFSDVVEQLKANNRSEAGRDSTHTNEMRMSREANNQSFAELQEAITGTRSAIAEQADNQPSASRLEEEAKEDASQTARTNTLLQKIAGGIGGILGNVKQKAKAVGGGLLSILKGTLLAGFFFALAKFLNSPLYGQIIDYLTGTLIPTLGRFYDAFFGPDGSFSKGMKELFNDETGLGLIVLGLGGVVATIATYKIATLFPKIKSGVTALGSFLRSASSGFGSMGLSKDKKGGGGGKLPAKGKGGGFGFIASMLRSIAGGLAAFGAPPVLIGLAAVTAAINGVALAFRIMSPAFEPIGKMLESFGVALKETFTGLRETIEGIGVGIREIVEGIGVAVGNVVDKISKLKTASTEAQTEQIKALSDIPADKLTAVAGGVDRLKKALEDFGGGTFSQVMKGLFGGDGPLDKIVELTKKVDEIMRVAEAIDVLAKAGGQYEVAKAELERRKRIAELETELAEIPEIKEGMREHQKERLAERKRVTKAELEALQKQQIDLGFIAGRNMGGRVRAGSMYLVNESGSELFIPDRNGMMVDSGRTAELMKGVQNQSGSASPIIVNAPSTVTSTPQTNNYTSRSTSLVNTDPILQAAMT